MFPMAALPFFSLVPLLLWSPSKVPGVHYSGWITLALTNVLLPPWLAGTRNNSEFYVVAHFLILAFYLLVCAVCWAEIYTEAQGGFTRSICCTTNLGCCYNEQGSGCPPSVNHRWCKCQHNLWTSNGGFGAIFSITTCKSCWSTLTQGQWLSKHTQQLEWTPASIFTRGVGIPVCCLKPRTRAWANWKPQYKWCIWGHHKRSAGVHVITHRLPNRGTEPGWAPSSTWGTSQFHWFSWSHTSSPLYFTWKKLLCQTPAYQVLSHLKSTAHPVWVSWLAMISYKDANPSHFACWYIPLGAPYRRW